MALELCECQVIRRQQAGDKCDAVEDYEEPTDDRDRSGTRLHLA